MPEDQSDEQISGICHFRQIKPHVQSFRRGCIDAKKTLWYIAIFAGPASADPTRYFLNISNHFKALAFRCFVFFNINIVSRK
jgi:hypothetical protein